MAEVKEGIFVKGFFRVQIVDDKGKIVGDSGLRPNQIKNDGWYSCIGALPLAHSNSYQALYGQLGSGATLNVTQTVVDGAFGTTTGHFIALTTSAMSSDASGATASVTFQHTSGHGTGTINQVGLCKTNAVGSLVCNNTFSSSVYSTNQSVNVTYAIQFQTL